jgi:hypothetical protein
MEVCPAALAKSAGLFSLVPDSSGCVPDAVQRLKRVHAHLRRAMALHRCSGTATHSGARNGPGSAAHHFVGLPPLSQGAAGSCCAAPGTHGHNYCNPNIRFPANGTLARKISPLSESVT